MARRPAQEVTATEDDVVWDTVRDLSQAGLRFRPCSLEGPGGAHEKQPSEQPTGALGPEAPRKRPEHQRNLRLALLRGSTRPPRNDRLQEALARADQRRTTWGSTATRAAPRRSPGHPGQSPLGEALNGAPHRTERPRCTASCPQAGRRARPVPQRASCRCSACGSPHSPPSKLRRPAEWSIETASFAPDTARAAAVSRGQMADRAGFEPADGKKTRQQISNLPQSTTLPPVRTSGRILIGGGAAVNGGEQEQMTRSSQQRTGGGSGIRTHETRRPNGFQDRRNRPLCHPSESSIVFAAVFPICLLLRFLRRRFYRTDVVENLLCGIDRAAHSCGDGHGV
jgi:hypothetical protein